MAAGLLAAAIGGFGKALSGIGEMEAKKQNEVKLRREIMNMESEEALRLDEIKFKRKMDRAPIEAVTTAKADVAGRSAGLDEAERLGLGKREADYAANKEKALFDAKIKAGVPEAQASYEAKQEAAGYDAKTAARVPEKKADYEATTASKTLEAREKLGVVEAEAKEAVRKDVAKLVAENGSEKAKLLAEQNVQTRLAQLAAITANKLDEAEARAKYNAFMTDLRIAKELGVDVAEMERAAEKEKARIDALIKYRVPAKEGQLANERKLEAIRAQLDSNIINEEANLLAKQEMAKIQAMTEQGVPEAEAKLLAAKWRAGKTQRDEAAAEKTQQEITSEIAKARSLAGNKTYLSDVGKIDIAKGAGERYNAQFRENIREKSEKKERERNSITIERQIKATQAQMADILGVEPKKVNEEKAYLEERVATGKANAEEKAKLAKLKPLIEDLDILRRDLRSLQRGGSSSTAGESTSSSGKRPDISSFNK